MKENLYLEARDSTVVKSNDLIQKSRYKLSLRQQKAILFLVSQIKPTDDDFKDYTFEIREFCRVCGLDSVGGNNYDALKAALKELSDKSIYIMINDNTEALVRWLEKVYIHKGTGLITVRFDKDMKPYLLHLHENFTSYELIYTLRMKHYASPRLYELLKSYHYDKLKPYTVEFELDRFKQILNIDKKTYDDFKYLRRFILNPAIKEINEQTDMKITMQTVVYKRFVTALRFTIEPQKPIDKFVHAAETDKVFLESQMQDKTELLKRKRLNNSKKKKSKAGTELKEETQLEQPQEAIEKPTEPLEYDFSTAKKNPYTEKLDPAQKETSTPAAQDAEPAGKPKRIQVRIYLKRQKGKPIKTFSSYDRTELDSKAKEWLEENSYPLYSASSGTSFRWEV